MSAVTEGIVLAALTFTASFGIFALVRHVPLLRACFGIQAPRRATHLAPTTPGSGLPSRHGLS